ncbi:MAG: hypothetical protein R2724_23900 [Bryobacterales bacterium]
MLLGFVSAILPDLSLEDVLDFAASEGWRLRRADVLASGQGRAALRGRHASGRHSARHRPKGLIAKTGVEISALGYYPNALAPDPAEAAAAVEHIGSHRRRGEVSVGMNTFIGRDWTKSVDDNWPRFLETWRSIIAHADEKGREGGHRELPDAVLSGRVAGRQEFGEPARHMAAHVRRHPEPQLWAQLRSVALGLMQMDLGRATLGVCGAHPPRAREGCACGQAQARRRGRAGLPAGVPHAEAAPAWATSIGGGTSRC